MTGEEFVELSITHTDHELVDLVRERVQQTRFNNAKDCQAE